jgi:glycosyltransferase involved in cell wall biosynthesis
LAAELNVLGSIVETGEVPQELLLALYTSALVFFFPSRFEGFGWPTIEAQCCGCPVICSNSGPLPEVAGEAALMHDVEDEEGFAEDIVRLAKDSAARDSLIEKGFENVLRYRPEIMISKYIALYQRTLTH